MQKVINYHNPEKPELPEGYEFPSRMNIQVKKIENKEDYIDLLLEADPSKDLKKIKKDN